MGFLGIGDDDVVIDATPYQNTKWYNPDDFNFGGDTDWFQEDAWARADAQDQLDRQLRGQAFGAQNRGLQIAEENEALANNQAGARAYQQDALDFQRQAAMGLLPSEAAYQMQSGLNQAVAGQTSAAASARGAASLANAQSNANANQAALQQQAYMNAAQLRAQEMAQARGAYGQQSQALNAADLQRLQYGNQMAQFNNQQALNNRSANDAYTQGLLGAAQSRGGLAGSYYQQGLGVQGQALNAHGQRQGLLKSGFENSQGIKANVQLGDQERKANERGAVYQVAGSAVMGGAAPPP